MPGVIILPMRINRYLARAGVASRRGAEILIADGLVEVNGEPVISFGLRINAGDTVTVKGIPVKISETRPVYLLLHKPVGCITTMHDPRGRPTVKDYLKGVERRVFPVGRLDKDVSGVLLFTDDGELANRLMHPRYEVDKTYRVLVEGTPAADVIKKLRNGVELEEGRTSPARVELKEPGHNAVPPVSALEITIHQGWKRQVKRMFEAVGHRVVKLERIRFAFLAAGSLQPGQFRYLNEDEIFRLKQLADC